MPDNLRTPIVCVLGHVDHGKTSLLDRIRGSKVTAGEAGAITQHIGATMIPFESIVKLNGNLGKIQTNVPGLLFIDTPGHQAFTTLRARGGALADIAILVVDVNEGFKQQTIEALQILRNCKTPFVIAATKIDRINGWSATENASFIASYKKQAERVKEEIETKIYELVGKLSEMGFNSERFDRVSDFQRNLVIVPISSKTGEGIGDLLMVMIGLAQRFLTENLKTTVSGPGVGTVLEVKEEKGLGTTLDVILYDGIINVGDEIGVATSDGAISTKVRALLQPRPGKEILVEDRFQRVKSVIAAAGVKITAPNLDGVTSGSPIRVIRGDRDAVLDKIESEMQEINVKLSETGITIRADTIGALEALSKELEDKNIPIMRAEVGPLSRRDLIEIDVMKEDYFKSALLFNVPMLPDAQEMIDSGESDTKIFESRVIYKLIDDYIEWRDAKEKEREAKQYEKVTLPAKFTLLPDCVFRMSGPAVVGVRVLGGTIRPRVDVITREGRIVGEIKQIKFNKENINEAKEGQEVAVSIDGVTIGRQIEVGDVLYVAVPERDVKILETEMLKTLNAGTVEALDEYTSIYRKTQPFWGK
ncbi:MAG TPA: translation initiation factor IF-2 [Methanocorpusculum sp.]|nr:translation initiation factor IF-2 [Methanocorpusculum sp.]